MSVTNFDDTNFSHGDSKVSKLQRSTHHKHRRRKVDDLILKYRENRKKPHKTKKRTELLNIVSETSDEEDYEYRNKRKKLANAVLVNKVKADTSLRSRLTKMIANSEACVSIETMEQKYESTIITNEDIAPGNTSDLVTKITDSTMNMDIKGKTLQPELKTDCSNEKPELIDISTDDEVEIINSTDVTNDCAIEPVVNKEESNQKSKPEDTSDEDLELLREHALKSKTARTQEIERKATEKAEINTLLSEDEDDAELRLICLKSAFLKKAIEHKQKQKLEKKLSQSTLYDEIIAGDLHLSDKSANNTDIESMDMDMGSDSESKDHTANGSSKSKDTKDQEKNIPLENIEQKDNNCNNMSKDKNIPKENIAPREEDIDEDEDLLRAKLLTSLSKNLPLLVDTSNLDKPEIAKRDEKASSPKEAEKVVDDKKFIINTGGSDSEGEHEATKNLTRMHIKLSEQIDFQQKLDMFLKSARSEVEKTLLPDVVQQPKTLPLPKTPQKFVPKVRHCQSHCLVQHLKIYSIYQQIISCRPLTTYLGRNRWNTKIWSKE